MTNGGPPRAGEQERKKPDERKEHAGEHREARDKTAKLKDYLHDQKTEALRKTPEHGASQSATTERISQIRKDSTKVRQYGLNDVPDSYGPEVQGRLSAEAGIRTRTRYDKSGLIILSDPESGIATAIEVKDLPAGPTFLRNNFVHRSGNNIEIAPRHPESDAAIENAWRRRENKPLVDLYGKAMEMDPRLREREKKTNKLLNNWYEKYLASGMTLSQAHEKVAQDALHVLKMTIAPLTGLSI